MSDRELRDEIEGMQAQLRAAQRQLANARTAMAGTEHLAKLQAKVDAARQQRTELTQRVRLARARVQTLEAEMLGHQEALVATREEIARLEPLGDPLGRENGHGCLQVIVAVAGLGGAIAGWWLT